MEWLNQNSAAVQAVATLVLVLVTIGYVFQTRSLAKTSESLTKEATKARLLGVLPLVVVRLDRFDSGAVELSAHNEGQGAAINLTVNWVVPDRHEGAYESLARVLRPGERVRHYLDLSHIEGAAELVSHTGCFRARYGDLLGGLYESETTRDSWGVRGTNPSGRFVIEPFDLPDTRVSTRVEGS